jgi:hypothetical protein
MQVYLFGTVGRAASLETWTMSRRWLLALASGGVLALGWAVLYWPALRRPGALLGLAVILAGIGLAAPDWAILAGQGAVLGVIVLAGGAFWSWLSQGHTPWPAAVKRPSLTRSTESRPRESPSTQPPLRTEPLPLSTAAPVVATPLEARP